MQREVLTIKGDKMPVTIKTASGKIIKGYAVAETATTWIIEYIDEDGECRTAEGTLVY
jgi:hypothetical protein